MSTWPSTQAATDLALGTQFQTRYQAAGIRLQGLTRQGAIELALVNLLDANGGYIPPAAGEVGVVDPTFWYGVDRRYGVTGSGDDATYLQNAITSMTSPLFVAAAAPVILTWPSISIGTGLAATHGQFSIIGAGRRTTTITALGAIDMLTIDPGGTTFASSVNLRGFRLDGNSLATKGLTMRYLNYSEVQWIEVINVMGIGIDLDTLQDCEFLDVDCRKCGVYATQKPGVRIKGFDDTSGLSNSIKWLFGDIERHRYTGLEIGDKVAACRFFGLKIHGQTIGDDPSPAAVDLAQINGSRRILFNGCQFTNARRYSLNIQAGAIVGNPDVRVIGSDFTDPINYQGGEAWHVVVGDGADAVIDDNLFSIGTDASYATNGGDVWIQSGATYVQGENDHKTLRTRADGGIKNEGSFYRSRRLGGIEIVGQSGATGQSAIQWRRATDTGWRYDLGDSGDRGGPGDGTADSGIQRAGTNRTKVLAASTSLEVARTVQSVNPLTQAGGGTLAIDASLGAYVEIDVTDTGAFNMGAPSSNLSAQILVFRIKNSSGGAMGAITWNAAYHMDGSYVNPANGKLVMIAFYRASDSIYVQVGKPTGDIT